MWENPRTAPPVSETHYETSDTFRPENVGDSDTGLSVDYIAQWTPRMGTWTWLSAVLLFLPLITLVGTLVFRVAGAYLLLPFVGSALVIGGVLAALAALLKRQPPTIVLVYLFSGVGCFALAILESSAPLPVVVLSLAFAQTAWLAHVLVTQAVRFLAGHPLLTLRQRAAWEGVLDRPANRRHYERGFRRVTLVLAACLLLWAGLLFVAPIRPLAAALAGLATVTAFVALAVWSAPRPTTADGRLGSRWSNLVYFRNLLAWFLNYEPHATAPGLLRPEITVFGLRSETLLARQCAAAVALVLLTASLAPAAGYFSLLLAVPSAWSDEVELGPDEAPEPLSTADIWAQLSAEEQALLNSRPAAERERFLEIRAEAANAAARARAEWLKRAQMAAFLNESPEAWIAVALAGLRRQPTFFLWALFLGFLFSLVVPLVLFTSVLAAIAVPVLRPIEQKIAALTAENQARGRTPWETYVTRILASPDAVERDSLWIGTHAKSDYPILLPTDVLREHAHILGDSGSGKTALALAPMMTQIIRRAGRDWAAKQTADAAGDRFTAALSSVVVIDLKGDPALFHCARLEAERAGLPFQWFTNQLQRATYAFNPFRQGHIAALSPNQRAEVQLEALGLSHGEGYGRSFFSRRNRTVLSRILQRFGQEIDSFERLYHYMDPRYRREHERLLQLGPQAWEDASELVATIESLRSHPALNVTPRTAARRVTPEGAVGPGCPREALAAQIDMVSVFRRPRVIYFYLPAGIEAASVREIGKLALFSLLSAAIHHEGQQRHPLQVYLFVDEFQQIVAENLEIVLRQARSKNIAAILANQTISDLRTASANLIPIVQANTRFKQFFASTDLAQQQSLMDAAGETVVGQGGETFEAVLEWIELALEEGYDLEEDPSLFFFKTSTGPRLTRNDVIRMTDDPQQSIVQLGRGKGYAQFGGFPFLLRGDFHIDEATYQRRAHMGWPQPTSETLFITPEHFAHPDERARAAAGATEDAFQAAADAQAEQFEQERQARPKAGRRPRRK